MGGPREDASLRAAGERKERLRSDQRFDEVATRIEQLSNP